MKRTIIISAVTTVLVNFLLYILSGWVIFLLAWIALGFLARKISSYGDMKNSNGWNYFCCNVFPPIIILIELFDKDNEYKVHFGKFIPKLPKFRNPFVWPEKSE